MRNAFINELALAAERKKNIALVVGDLGYKVVEPFAEQFPDRFFNAGIAEQNMMGMAAGLASEGLHVFAYSIANFPTFRCAEQIRNDVDYHELPVTVVSVGGGVAYGNLGYSHHAIQDYALMRTLPNMLIASPSDPMETRACIQYLIENPQPSYLRLGKAGERNLHEAVPELEPGAWLTLRSSEGPDRAPAFLVTGAIGQDLLLNRLKLPGLTSDSSIYSIPLWGMKWKERQQEYFGKHEHLSIVEDHLIDGGLGSYMLEALNLSSFTAGQETKIRLLGLSSSVCGMVGSQDSLHQLGFPIEDSGN